MAAIETTAASVMTGNTPRSVKAVIASARVTTYSPPLLWGLSLERMGNDIEREGIPEHLPFHSRQPLDELPGLELDLAQEFELEHSAILAIGAGNVGAFFARLATFARDRVKHVRYHSFHIQLSHFLFLSRPINLDWQAGHTTPVEHQPESGYGHQDQGTTKPLFQRGAHRPT